MKNLGGKKENAAKKTKPKPDDKEQSQRFVETAKTLDVDKSGKAFENAIKIIKSPKRTAAQAHPFEKRSSS